MDWRIWLRGIRWRATGDGCGCLCSACFSLLWQGGGFSRGCGHVHRLRGRGGRARPIRRFSRNEWGAFNRIASEEKPYYQGPIASTPRTSEATEVLPRMASTAAAGQGATVLSPAAASPGGGRASVRFASLSPPRRLFLRPAAPVQNRRRPGRPSLKEKCFVWTACPTVLPACRSFVSYPLFCLASVHRKNRGPRATGRVAAGAALLSPMAACAQTAAVLHRLASPIDASSWTRIAVPSGATVPHVRSSCATGAFGGMPQVGRLVHPGANVRCRQAGRF